MILPIVLAQNEGRWGIATRFRDLLDIPPGMEEVLGADVPDFRFRLIELSEMPFQKIAGTPEGILILRILKADVSGELLGGDVWDESLLAQVSRDVFELVLRYLLSQDIDHLKHLHREAIRCADVESFTRAL